MEAFQEKKGRFGSTSMYFGYLLYQFKNNKCIIAQRNGIAATVNYQEKGLFLERIDFRPVENQWVQMKLLASAHNMSVCSFFVMLLLLDIAGALCCVESGGVPRKLPKITLSQTITLYSIPEFIRNLHLRI